MWLRKGLFCLDVIKKTKLVSKVNFEVKIFEGKGDPSVLISNPKKLMSEFDWRPKYNNLEKIIKDALSWEKKL